MTLAYSILAALLSRSKLLFYKFNCFALSNASRHEHRHIDIQNLRMHDICVAACSS